MSIPVDSRRGRVALMVAHCEELRAPFRRIVTGHDAEGRAVILEDAPPPRVAGIGGEHGAP